MQSPYHLSPLKLSFVGAVSIGYGVWSFYSKRQRLKTWIRTNGTVENVRRDRNGNVSVRVRFADTAGQTHGCTLPYADGQNVGLGTEVQIAYRPSNPTQAFVADRRDMNLTAIVSAVVGLALWCAAVLVASSR
jgi:hypothetical protein